MPSRTLRIVIVLFGAAAGAFVGGGIAAVFSRPTSPMHFHLARYAPLPHHVPQFSGGVALRFAMVHDVIHERFPRHGVTHYRERNRLTRERLANLAPRDPARFPLLDDLAVGLDRLGDPEEAARIMRAKLTAQEDAGISGRALYTSLANLGTFLIHANFVAAIEGDGEAQQRFREGVGFIKRSVRVNPDAHFGRERWQAAIAEFLLAAMDDPQLLTRFDCLGNRLDLEIDQILDPYGGSTSLEYSQPMRSTATSWIENGHADYLRPGLDPADPEQWSDLHPIRNMITRIGAESGWQDVPVPSHRKPFAFDAPVLGIIGMWRQGGGANPHFALALGETMLRVGQRYIAWTAFARAAEMSARFWPDPATQEFLVAHCRRRQREIERSIREFTADGSWGEAEELQGNGSDFSTHTTLLSTYESELAYGRAFQQAYQEYEAKRIAAGTSINEEDFFAEFFAGRAKIASEVGREEYFAHVPKPEKRRFNASLRRRGMVFGAGIGALGSVVFVTLLVASFRAASKSWHATQAIG